MSVHEKVIHKYLREKVDNGLEFFKSKYIAEEVGGISSKTVGAILFKLSTNPQVKDLEIKQWSSSTSTTWRVTRVTRT